MSAPAPAPGYDPAQHALDEQRTWATMAHVAYFANFLLPFGGLVAAIVLLNMRRRYVPYVRDNFCNALNSQITFAAVTSTECRS